MAASRTPVASSISSALLLAVLCLPTTSGASEGVGYVSSASGYMLHQSGSSAVTANWSGQSPIEGFAGYGPLRLAGRCLTAKGPAGQVLTWEACRSGDKAQVWALSRGRLNNELGWCADVEGNRAGAGVRVIAWQCSGAVNQRWKGHPLVRADSVASRIADPAARRQFVDNASRAAPGQLISLESGQLVGPDANNVRRAAGNVMVAAGRGQLIAAGGLN